MQLQAPFNAQQFDPTQGGGAQLPIGTYPVVIRASEVKATKDQTGGMIVFEAEITEGQFKGQTGVFRLNLYSQSDQARQIAEKQLSAICHATGVFMLQDTAQLHNLPFGLVVGLQRDPAAAEKGYTEVKKFLNSDGSDIHPGGGQAAQAPVQQQASPSPAPAPAAAWGGGAAATPAATPAAAPAASAWAQNTAGGAAAGKPAWGKS